MTDSSIEEELIRYTARDLLSLTPGKIVRIFVSQENIDLAIPGDKRNCAFVLAIHSAIESCYRAEVAGNHVYIWIEYGDEKWELEFYMTEEVWDLANMFDKNRADVHPTTIPIHFRSGVQRNRQRKSSRRVNKYKPGAPKAKIQSQVLEAASNKSEETFNKPVVKPLPIPGKMSNGQLVSRWDRGQFYTAKKAS